MADGLPTESSIKELFPPGLASVCFFDAEKLDALSSPDQRNVVLSATRRRLLGLDLVERLDSDLDRYTTLQGGGLEEARKLREESCNFRNG